MNNKQLYREIGEIDELLIEKALVVTKKNPPKKKLIKLVSLVASVVIMVGIIAISITLINTRNRDFKLSLSKGNIKVNYTDNTPDTYQDTNLVSLSEDELFTKYYTTIIMGTICEIKDIVVDLNGDKLYWSIVKIKVIKIYRGDCNENDIISVILPCPKNKWVEDAGIASAMQEGMTGIFMPIKYTESSIREQNGTKLYKKDIADYGLADGERFAFLETDNGLIFAKIAYQSISNAKTLDDIEKYIKSMIN